MNAPHPSERQQHTLRFLAEMRVWLGRAGPLQGLDADSFDARVRAAASRLEAECAGFKTDLASSEIVDQTAAVTATYDVLTQAGLPGATAIAVMVDALGKWLRENEQAYCFKRLGISPNEPHLAFEQARANFKARGERFGSHFRYEQEVSDDDRSFVNITHCLYHELGRFLGRPQVTRVFCAMDTIWADYATAKPFNLRFERPTTLATGGDKCRFQFTRRKPRPD